MKHIKRPTAFNEKHSLSDLSFSSSSIVEHRT